ncbi:sulfurtransferase [Bacteroidetes/Chlorobi group bacterium Naka2016]|jgi:hypothetical protein|nr:MAG: sulfurtransferase [Bacteroidetes/Chlorobi group bacterium Naka2016]
MIAPFYKFGMFGEEFSLIIAFLIGIAFGFFLERAGFGSARKLAAQFYLYDMTVFKVMFTAIVTAMLGVYFLGVFGFLDINLIYFTPTYVVPQIVGGFLLGFGFIIGGYCPGTSVVSTSIGRLDGLFFLIGVFIGTFIYGEIYPWIADFAKSTPMGKATIYEVLHIPYGVVVFAVVLIAVCGFAGATYIEKKFQSKLFGR